MLQHARFWNYFKLRPCCLKLVQGQGQGRSWKVTGAAGFTVWCSGCCLKNAPPWVSLPWTLSVRFTSSHHEYQVRRTGLLSRKISSSYIRHNIQLKFLSLHPLYNAMYQIQFIANKLPPWSSSSGQFYLPQVSSERYSLYMPKIAPCPIFKHCWLCSDCLESQENFKIWKFEEG